jgi:hypothetical protein
VLGASARTSGCRDAHGKVEAYPRKQKAPQG